jgi:hypothetical protein
LLRSPFPSCLSYFASQHRWLQFYTLFFNSHLFFFPPPPLFSIRFLTFGLSSFCTHSFCCLHHRFLPLCLCYPYIRCSPLLF